MLNRKIFWAALVLCAGGLVHADEQATQDAVANETKMKVEDATNRKNVAPGGDVDELITNNKMRAETGSKSRWSFASALNYSGGSIQKPLAEDRPNIGAASGILTKADLDGSLSAKMNLNAQNSLSAGVGVRWIAPLQGKPHNYGGETFDASNPYVTYQYLYKFSGIQSVFQLSPTAYTNANLTREGYLSALAISQDMIYEVPHTGLSLGLYVWGQGAVYDKTGPLGDPKDTDNYMADVRADQSDYGLGADPFLEYQLTDKINLRTVANLWNYEHIRNEPRAMTYRWDKVNESVGIGFSVTRDIFIYPNLQFLPDNIRADLTNVAINTNINLF